MLKVCHTKSTQHKHNYVDGLSSLQQFDAVEFDIKICAVTKRCKLVKKNMFWSDARAYCMEELHGELANIARLSNGHSSRIFQKR